MLIISKFSLDENKYEICAERNIGKNDVVTGRAMHCFM